MPARAARWTTASTPVTAACDGGAVGERRLDEVVGDAVEIRQLADRQVVEDPDAIAALGEPRGEGEPMNPAPPVTRTVRGLERRSGARPRRPRPTRAAGSGTQRTFWTKRRRVDPVARGRRSSSSIVSISSSFEQARLEPELEELRVLGVVVVLLELLARVRRVRDRDVPAEVLAGGLHPLGQLEDAELLGELVVDAQLARVGRVGGGQGDALDRVADVQVAAGLAALAVDA